MTTRFSHNDTKLKLTRKNLRKNQTTSENILWNKIRNNQLGFKFRRQFSILNFIVDFYCPKLKLIIEVDGYIHGENKNKEKDFLRQEKLKKLGYNILRYRNEQIVFDLDAVTQDIINNLNKI